MTNKPDPTSDTPAGRIETFKQELVALQEKYQVRLVPVIKTYNGGQQIADVEIVTNAPPA